MENLATSLNRKIEERTFKIEELQILLDKNEE